MGRAGLDRGSGRLPAHIGLAQTRNQLALLSACLHLRSEVPRTFHCYDSTTPSINFVHPPSNFPTNNNNILAIAFAHHAAIFNGGDDEYRTVPENTSGRLSPTSSLINGNYKWIVYHRFILTGRKTYFEIATAIDAEWLVVSVYL
jgi:hypothetical protein